VSQVIPEYDYSMKTAISVPDDIFESADGLAERLGVSRSELYATAVAEYLAKHRDEDVTARLNSVYAEEGGALDASIKATQARALNESEW
jgi:antitoxin MazE6